MDDPSQDPVCVEDDFDTGVRCQHPVYVGDQFDARLQSVCTISSNNPSGNKICIVKVNIPDEKPDGTVSLDSLSVEDVCYLLDHCRLHAITSIARENQFSGNILATGVESTDDLKEFDIKSVFAQSLFKHILKWKAEGVPADIYTGRSSALAVSSTMFPSVGPTEKVAQNNQIDKVPPPSESGFQQSTGKDGPINSFLPPFVRLPSEKSEPGKHQNLKPIVQENESNERSKQEENVQTERIRKKQEKDRLARERKAIEIQNLQAALWALENDRHTKSGRIVFAKDLNTVHVEHICCMCTPGDARLMNRMAPSCFDIDCKHNKQLVDEVLELSDVRSQLGKKNLLSSRAFSNLCKGALEFGNKRLQDLQK